MTNNFAYPELPLEESIWRPDSATDIILRDSELAKLGLLAQLEAQCKMHITTALKGAEGLSNLDWEKLDCKPMEQLVAKLLRTARLIDPILESLTEAVSDRHAQVLKFRHQSLHSIWGWNSEIGEPMAVDNRRRETLFTSGLNNGMQEVAKLTFQSKACLNRVGQLIENGTLPESIETGGPHIRVNGKWIRL